MIECLIILFLLFIGLSVLWFRQTVRVRQLEVRLAELDRFLASSDYEDEYR